MAGANIEILKMSADEDGKDGSRAESDLSRCRKVCLEVLAGPGLLFKFSPCSATLREKLGDRRAGCVSFPGLRRVRSRSVIPSRGDKRDNEFDQKQFEVNRGFWFRSLCGLMLNPFPGRVLPSNPISIESGFDGSLTPPNSIRQTGFDSATEDPILQNIHKSFMFNVL